ncbi:MAG: DUF1566 domain-containing protein [Candidatus Krumholzibacteriia bacterium]
MKSWTLLLRLVLPLLCLAQSGCSDDGTAPEIDNTGDDPIATIHPYTIVDTGQSTCYDLVAAIACPAAGEDHHGQDSQHDGFQPSYQVSSDGLTVADLVTGLVWQRMADTDGDGQLGVADKLTWEETRARADTLNTTGFAGHDDWRLPSVKELYSLILFSGTDPDPNGGAARLVPFIDDEAFVFVYGDPDAGERVIDAQYASSTMYAYEGMPVPMLFGVNFADGRIKGYNLTGPDGSDKTFYVLCVRGNTDYGANHLVDSGDGTISDLATGLRWAQDDSGVDVPGGLNWGQALAWVAEKNAAGYLGHDDWRLPCVKELQSIVDYTRSPDTSGSAAIDPLFACTVITNERGQVDYGFYWSSTTHARANGTGSYGSYVTFGRALGYMNGNWVDVHGAGAQRSDPKEGDPADYPEGHGLQGDAIRILNQVRLVRNAD